MRIQAGGQAHFRQRSPRPWGKREVEREHPADPRGSSASPWWLDHEKPSPGGRLAPPPCKSSLPSSCGRWQGWCTCLQREQSGGHRPDHGVSGPCARRPGTPPQALSPALSHPNPSLPGQTAPSQPLPLGVTPAISECLSGSFLKPIGKPTSPSPVALQGDSPGGPGLLPPEAESTDVCVRSLQQSPAARPWVHTGVCASKCVNQCDLVCKFVNEYVSGCESMRA